MTTLSAGTLAMIVAAVLFGLGLLLLLLGSLVYPPVGEMTAAFDWTTSIGVLLLLLAVHGFILREESHVLAKLGLLCLFLVPTALALSLGGVMALNGTLDRGPPTDRRAPVLAATVAASSAPFLGPTHRLQVQSWRPGESDPWIDVGRALYESVTPGTSWLAVTTKPGRLGVEWIAGVRAAPRR